MPPATCRRKCGADSQAHANLCVTGGSPSEGCSTDAGGEVPLSNLWMWRWEYTATLRSLGSFKKCQPNGVTAPVLLRVRESSASPYPYQAGSITVTVIWASSAGRCKQRVALKPQHGAPGFWLWKQAAWSLVCLVQALTDTEAPDDHGRNGDRFPCAMLSDSQEASTRLSLAVVFTPSCSLSVPLEWATCLYCLPFPYKHSQNCQINKDLFFFPSSRSLLL